MAILKLLVGYMSIGFITFFLDLLSSVAQAPTKRLAIDQEIQSLVKVSRTEKLKQLVSDNAVRLKGRNITDVASRNAFWNNIDFFYDIGAKDVLFALLMSSDREAKRYVSRECMGGFGIEDVVALYEAASVHAKNPLLQTDERFDGKSAIVHSLSVTTSRILGLPPTVPKSHESSEIRLWWFDAIRTAKEKRTYQIDLQGAVKYFGKKPQPSKAVDILEQQREALLKRLRNEAVKEMAKSNMQWLRPEPAGEKDRRREAVLFFYDIKAAGVLAALLYSENKDLKDLMVKECLNVFGVKDVVALYEGATAHAKGADANAADLALIHKLAKRTAQILRLEPTVPKSAKAEDVRAWWAQAVREAQTSGIYQAEIDAALKYFEKK